MFVMYRSWKTNACQVDNTFSPFLYNCFQLTQNIKKNKTIILIYFKVSNVKFLIYYFKNFLVKMLFKKCVSEKEE